MSKARKSLMAFMVLVGTTVAPMAALQSMGQELTDENGNKEERYIFIIQKVKHTPNNFPRQYAQILKKPL